ncbi:MAG: hypothetical protein JNM84_19030 [Planctomycetes bacterium]|nr:hypothetical protein [Planctomycetota bacterium]
MHALLRSSHTLAALLAPVFAAVLASGLALGARTPEEERHDRIVLASGKEVHCRVLHEGPDTLVYDDGKRHEVKRADVREVHSVERSLREFLTKLDATSKSDAQALAALARWCEEEALLGEATATWIRVVAADPENEEAWTKLGAVKSKKGWRVRQRSRLVTVEEYRKGLADWKNAFELRTAHYLLRTDIPPRNAVDLAIAIERVHQAYYDMLAPVVPLYVFEEVPEIHIHVNPTHMPKPPSPGEKAWFEVLSNRLTVDADQEGWELEAVRRMADLLTYNSFRRTTGKQGEMPAWLQEGLGQSFVGAARRGDEGLRFEFGVPLRALFATHAKDTKPVHLQTLLGSGFAAFRAGSDAERLVAQAYTLLQFLVHGNDGAHRAALATYLQSAFHGQGALVHLEKALGWKEAQIDASWKSYVELVHNDRSK